MTGTEPLVESVRRGVDIAVDHLLASLDESWPLGRLAAAAGYSAYQFHRMFGRAMGETPAPFVARARVERAAALLHADPTLTLTTAAAAVGYPSPSQLSRAFRARFGTAPSGWDRSSPLHDRAQHPVLCGYPLQYSADTLVDTADDSAVSVRRLPGFGYAYRRILDPYGSSQLVDAWHDLAAWVTTEGGGHSGCRVVGMSWDDPDVVPAAWCRYDLGVTVDPLASIPPGTTRRWVPSCRVAARRVCGDLATVDAAWQALYRTWLPSSGYTRAPLPAMEWFRDDPARVGWAQWDLDCLVPVVTHRKIGQVTTLRGRRQSAGHGRPA